MMHSNSSSRQYKARSKNIMIMIHTTNNIILEVDVEVMADWVYYMSACMLYAVSIVYSTITINH